MSMPPSAPPAPSPVASPSAPGPEPRPSLADLAEILHCSTTNAAGPVLVTIEEGEKTVSFGTWPIPEVVDHPADILMGFVAPASWTAFGLVTNGRLHHLDTAPRPDGPGRGRPIRATVLLSRTGEAASIIEHPGQPLEFLPEPPQGWVADALARVLGQPTPPPAESLAGWVETVWLDHIATLVLDQPGQVRSWPELAQLHPLAPDGPPVAGTMLAAQSAALNRESHWGRIRQLWGASRSERPPVSPPGGTVITPEAWFDDGSFARWSQRNLPPGEVVLPAVLNGLPDALASELLQALTTVTAEGRAA